MKIGFIIGKILTFCFPETIKRLQKLDLIKQEYDSIQYKMRMLDGLRATPSYRCYELCAEYNRLKYWFMKPMKLD